MKKRTIVWVSMLIFAVSTTAFASAPDGDDGNVCQSKTWLGSYVVQVPINGKQFLEYFQFGESGTVRHSATFYPEQMISSGTSTPSVGTWKCRTDGTIALTLIFASFPPDGAGDLTLGYHVRASLILQITGKKVLTRTKLVARVYPDSFDPTNPNIGFIAFVTDDPEDYTKLEVSDADLAL